VSDTSTQAPPTTISQPVGGLVAPTIGSSISAVNTSAPELSQSPGLVVGVASSGGDTVLRSQTVAHAANTISNTNAQNRVAATIGDSGELANALNWFGNHVGQIGSDVIQGAKTAGSDVLNAMNAPLRQVQHEYRYLHDVEATHGMMAATLEGIGLAAGAAAGFAGTGSLYGAELGAEVAGGIEGQVFYKDSWARTASASYVDPHTNQQVSMGRDLASFLGSVGIDTGRQGTVPYRLTSGIIDGLFDLNAGGGEVLGLTNEARSAEGLGGALNARWGGTAIHTVGDAVNGVGVVEPNEIDRITSQYSGIRRAFADIAAKTPEQIIATPAYQPFRQIAQQLGDAQTVDEVAQVFKGVLRTQELAFTDRLPSLSWTRLHFGQQLREMVEAGTPTQVDRVGIHPLQRLGSLVNPANMAQRITPLPVAYDDAAHALVQDSFNPASKIDDGTVGIHRMLRFTEDTPTSASTAWAYHNMADVGQKVLAYRNISLNSLFAISGMRGYMNADLTLAPDVAGYLRDAFTNPEDRAAMKTAIDNAVGGGMFGKEAWYGVDDEARNISLVRAEQGDAQYGAGIWKNQTGKLAFLDLGAARRAGAQMAGARDVIGRLDDFAYHAITQGIFKPLVLLTPSYAEHIALAEDIPNSLREGILPLVKSKIAQNIAKLGARIGDTPENDGKQVGAIAGLAYDMVVGTMDKLPSRLTNDLYRRIENAAIYLDATDGAAVAPGLASMHAYQAEVAQEDGVVHLLRRSYFDSAMKSSKDFGIIGPTDKAAVPAMRAAIREISNDETGQLAAQELIAGAKRGENLETASGNARRVVAQYLRDHPNETDWALRENPGVTAAVPGFTRPADWDNFDEWAHVKVSALRGVVRGADKSTNAGILAHIAEGTTPSRAELEAIAPESRPLIIKNREMVPDPSGGIQKIANQGFRRVLNPMVNFLSRQPIGLNEFDRQWEMQKPFIDAGVKSYDEALNVAMDRTVNRVMRNVHNLTDRTQWTVTLRNWAPFYFAQEQAYRRMGRLLAEDPRAFRQYQLMISNVVNTGQIFQGPNQKGYFVMPGTGWLSGSASFLGALAIGKIPIVGSQPIGMGWNLNASSVIFPLSAGFRPDLGPVVGVPTQAVAQAIGPYLPANLQADMTVSVDTILGPTASQSLWANMVPNTILQRLLEGRITGFDERSFNSTAMQVLQTLDFEHKIPNPTEMLNPRLAQAFMDRWRSQVQVMYAAKAIVGAITPISPELQVQNWGLPSELSNDITAQGSLLKGMQVFLGKHPDASPFTVWQSSSNEGINVPASVAAEKIIVDNMHLINNPKYGNAALLLLVDPGVNATYNAAVYNEQIAQGIRAKLKPFDASGNGQFPSFLNQLYVSAGDAIVLGKWYPQYEKQIQGLTGSEKYQAEQNWQTTLTNYASMNPIWGEAFNPGGNFSEREAQRGDLIKQMRALLASSDAPHNRIADQTRTLLTKYDAYQNSITVGTQDGFIGQSQSSLNLEWKDSLYAEVAAHPEMTNVVTGLFLSIPQSATVPASAPGETPTPGTFSAKSWNQAA